MRIMALFIFISILSGCAVYKVHENFHLGTGSDESIIVLSTRTQDRCGGLFVTSGLTFYPIVHGEIKQTIWAQDGIALIHGPTDYDFTDPPGYFYARPIKAGDYRLDGFSKAVYGGTYNSKKSLNMDFHIEPGRVYYLGEIYIDIPDCTRYVIRVNDQRQRDGLLFNKKMKNLNSSMFEYQILKEAKEPTPYAAVRAILPPPRQNASPSTMQAISPSSSRENVSSVNRVVNSNTGQAKIGKFSFVVEKMAKENGCQGNNGAYLTTEPGPVEAYKVECDGGPAFLTRCEYSICKPQK